MISSRQIINIVCLALMSGVFGYVAYNHFFSSSCSIKYVPFDDSMALSQYPDSVSRKDYAYVYDTFKKVYDVQSQVTPDFESPSRIPKIIHVMWLGGKLPEEFESYVQSWYTYHPDWTILFWTDSEKNYDRGNKVVHNFDDLAVRLREGEGQRIVIDASKLSYDNKQFYDAARNYGEKSDILKWEIVYRFGGTYVDTDFECLSPLDVFHHTYDFYTGIQPLDTSMVQLGAALYGAIAHHPVLKACVDGIAHNQHINQIVVKTGPVHFTKKFLELAGKTGLRDIALPSSYFYPCSYEQRGMPRSQWAKVESCAVHHWAGSWLKPEAFVRT